MPESESRRKIRIPAGFFGSDIGVARHAMTHGMTNPPVGPSIGHWCFQAGVVFRTFTFRAAFSF
jgi:hypothetical protein